VTRKPPQSKVETSKISLVTHAIEKADAKSVRHAKRELELQIERKVAEISQKKAKLKHQIFKYLAIQNLIKRNREMAAQKREDDSSRESFPRTNAATPGGQETHAKDDSASNQIHFPFIVLKIDNDTHVTPSHPAPLTLTSRRSPTKAPRITNP
jgi:hypothetical protein